MKISRLGEAPDYRFSLANERTFSGVDPYCTRISGGGGLGLINLRQISPRPSSANCWRCCCVCFPAG